MQHRFAGNVFDRSAAANQSGRTMFAPTCQRPEARSQRPDKTIAAGNGLDRSAAVTTRLQAPTPFTPSLRAQNHFIFDTVNGRSNLVRSLYAHVTGLLRASAGVIRRPSALAMTARCGHRALQIGRGGSRAPALRFRFCGVGRGRPCGAARRGRAATQGRPYVLEARSQRPDKTGAVGNGLDRSDFGARRDVGIAPYG